MTPEELIAWRRAKGMNQAQVADHLGVRRATVTDWERRHHAIPDDLYLRLEKAAAPHDVTRRRDDSGAITNVDYASLYDRREMRYVPNTLHPNTLARKGLLGWPGCTWHNAHVQGASKPHRAILATNEYIDAVHDFMNGRRHPGIVARDAFYAGGTIPEGCSVSPAGLLQLPRLEAFEPWDGFHFCADMPPVVD